MRTSHQLRKRINLILVFVAVFPVLIMAFFMRNEAANSMNRLIRDDLDNMARLIDFHLAGKLSDAYDTAFMTIASDGFHDALARHDVEKLEKLLLPIYGQMKIKQGLSILEVGNAEGIVLFRAHEPSLSGDDKSGTEALRFALGGQPYAGIFAGQHGMGLRVVLPVLQAGILVGTIQTGFRFEPSFLSEMGLLVGDRIAVYDKVFKQVAPLADIMTREEYASLLPDLQEVIRNETNLMRESGY